MKNKQKNIEKEVNINRDQEVIDYFSKIDTSTREFYIKTVLKIYYLLHENK